MQVNDTLRAFDQPLIDAQSRVVVETEQRWRAEQVAASEAEQRRRAEQVAASEAEQRRHAEQVAAELQRQLENVLISQGRRPESIAEAIASAHKA